MASARVEFVPKDTIEVDPALAAKIAALLEALEENDDVQHVHVNAEFPEGFEA